jgi:hypothetical protein
LLALGKADGANELGNQSQTFVNHLTSSTNPKPPFGSLSANLHTAAESIRAIVYVRRSYAGMDKLGKNLSFHDERRQREHSATTIP